METELFKAVDDQNIERIIALLSQGSNVNSKNSDGDSLLHYLIKKKSKDVFRETINERIVQILIDRGADVNLKNAEGYDVLTQYLNISGVWFKLDCAIIKILIDAGANVHSIDKKGWTLLHCAAMGKSIDLINFLLNRGADINAKTLKNLTPLHMAVVDRYYPFLLTVNEVYAIVKLLLKRGANINALSINHETPLMHAIANEGMFSILFDWEADVNILALDGSNILSYKRQLKSWVWQSVIKNISLLLVLDKPLHQSILQTISHNPKYKSYFDCCNDELHSLKQCKLDFSGVTMFNLLVDKKNKLLEYAKNKFIVKSFKKIGYLCLKYHIYGDWITHNFETRILKQKIKNKSANVLSQCLPCHFGPKHLVIKKILSFCKTKDLKMLVEKKYVKKYFYN